MKILLIAFLVLLRFNSYGQLCQCDKSEREVNFKNKVIICGTVDSDAQGGTTVLSEISIRDCKSDKIIYQGIDDGSVTYSINKFSDSVIITELQLVSDSSMRQLTWVPLSNAVLKIGQTDEPYLSPFNFVFKIPKLTGHQKKYLDTLCQKLKKDIKQPQIFYPFDETSIYALFLGALAKYKCCHDLFINLDKYYILDRSIAETKDEIPFEYIAKNIKNSLKR